MVNKDVRAAIQQLKSLNLEATEFFAVKKAVIALKNISLLVIEFSAGNFIVRGRCDTNPENVFKRPREISYVSTRSKIKQFNRASRPGVPVFYGCIRNDSNNRSAEDGCFVLSLNESSKLLNNSSIVLNETQFEYNTMGKWRIQRPLRLAVIAHKKDFQEKNPTLKELHKYYEESIKSKSNCEDVLFVSEFLSEQFGKVVDRESSYEYKISAAFSEYIFEQRLDGIIYPSVKAADLGFNIALNPKCIINKDVVFEKALVWRIEARGTNIFPTSWLFCNQLSDSGTFIWKDAGPYHSLGNYAWTKFD